MPDELTAAIQNALYEWNAKSDITGIVLDQGGGDLSIVEDTATLDAQDVACAGYDASPDRIPFEIWFATEVERINDIDDLGQRNQAMAEYMAKTQTVFAHELGHFLGLDQASATSGSIMAGAQSGVTCASAINTIPSDARTVTTTDAGKGSDCSTRYIMPETEFPASGYEDVGDPPDGEDYEGCYGYDWVQETWRFDGQHWCLWYTAYDLLYVSCEPP